MSETESHLEAGGYYIPALSLETEVVAKRIAFIIGESSAAASAIKELERRRESGLDAWLEQSGQFWLVHSR